MQKINVCAARERPFWLIRAEATLASYRIVVCHDEKVVAAQHRPAEPPGGIHRHAASATG
ncbi:MAG TPA: hypothetical protein VIY52_29875 [Streptosporangiaceae bacterium]